MLARPVTIGVDGAVVHGDLVVPDGIAAMVVFAHGGGSGRHSPRNRQVAQRLQQHGLGTLLLDLLTEAEETVDADTAELRFDIGLLAGRLAAATRWLDQHDVPEGRMRLGYFGASTGAAAALVAAAAQGDRVGAVVSRGGRPDLAGNALRDVLAPTLFIVGGRDEVVLDLNRRAGEWLRCEHRLEIVPGATHLFGEPGALEEVADLAASWFTGHLASVPIAHRGRER